MNRVVIMSAMFAFLWSPGGSYLMSQQEVAERLYLEWHKILRQNGVITEPLYFSIYGPPDLARVVTEIKANRFKVADYLCQKIADEFDGRVTQQVYQDVILLEHVAGIDLVHMVVPTDNIGNNIRALAETFRREFHQGIYMDPSPQIAQIIEMAGGGSEKEARLGTNLALRRYGIYGLPELIRQIKANNSDDAFAASLIICGDRTEFREYYDRHGELFVSKESKLKRITEHCSEMLKERDASTNLLMQRIGRALER